MTMYCSWQTLSMPMYCSWQTLSMPMYCSWQTLSMPMYCSLTNPQYANVLFMANPQYVDVLFNDKPLVCRCTVHGKPYIYFNPCAYHFAHVVCYSNNTSITKCIQLLSNHFNEHQNSRNQKSMTVKCFFVAMS